MRHWLDTYYGRVGDPTDSTIGPVLYPIDYTPGFNPDKDAIKVQPSFTQASESAVPVPTAVKDQVTAQMSKLNKPQLDAYGKKVWTALQLALFPAAAMNYVYVMLYMESGGWQNTPTRKDNNPGNIMYYKGGKKGVYVAANKTYAAHFTTLNQFAGKLYQVLNKGAYPLKAVSLEDFVHRLKLNNYFGKQSESSYLAAMLATAKKLGMVDSYKQAMTKKMVAMNDPKNPGKIVGWVLIGVSALVVIKVIKEI